MLRLSHMWERMQQVLETHPHQLGVGYYTLLLNCLFPLNQVNDMVELLPSATVMPSSNLTTKEIKIQKHGAVIGR